MLTTLCLLILAYWITGKSVDPLLERVKHVNWHDMIIALVDKLRPYALKAGRAAARPLLQFYYVMEDEDTTTLDRILIYGAIIYTLSPVSLLPSAVYKLLGILDEGVAILYVFNKIKERITADIDAKVEETLDEWFGVEYEMVEG